MAGGDVLFWKQILTKSFPLHAETEPSYNVKKAPTYEAAPPVEEEELYEDITEDNTLQEEPPQVTRYASTMRCDTVTV